MNISFSYYPEGRKKALTMSYDDGQIHDRRLAEIFNKHKIKGTFHLNSGTFDKEPFINSSEVEKLYKGHEISAHSVTHPFLNMIPKEALVEEIMEDRKSLETLAGYPVRGMSYPFGVYNEELLKALPVFGIEYSRTVNSHGRFNLPSDFLEWHPTCHHEHNILDKLTEFQATKSWTKMPLFYIWGHSYEFDRNNNWNLIEDFCSKAAFDEDVWYATNIEIMDYVMAVRALKFSVAKNMVFNPSALPVWIGVEGEPVKIEPGKLICL